MLITYASSVASGQNPLEGAFPNPAIVAIITALYGWGRSEFTLLAPEEEECMLKPLSTANNVLRTLDS